YALTNLCGEAARFWVMFGQILVDLACCVFIAELAARCAGRNADSRNVYRVALWLAALCPFTANYTAVPLTETLTIFWTTLALATLAPTVNPEQAFRGILKLGRFPRRSTLLQNVPLAGRRVGFAALVMRRSPLP